MARGSAESGKVEAYMCARVRRNPLVRGKVAEYLGTFTAGALPPAARRGSMGGAGSSSIGGWCSAAVLWGVLGGAAGQHSGPGYAGGHQLPAGRPRVLSMMRTQGLGSGLLGA
jgi:hypothetical protein